MKDGFGSIPAVQGKCDCRSYLTTEQLQHLTHERLNSGNLVNLGHHPTRHRGVQAAGNIGVEGEVLGIEGIPLHEFECSRINYWA
ncbi:MAG TPA: hypothetical protein VIG31_09425 [Rhodanobacteraceae bacterium]